MRQISRGPLGSELQKTEARASMPQRQISAPVETNGSLSRQGEEPRKTLLTMVCECIARMFNYLFEMMTRLFADYASVPAVENRAREPSELMVNPPIDKQPGRQVVVGPREEPTVKSANVTYKSAPLTLSAFFPKEDAARVTRPAPEQSSDWSAGTPGSSATPSRSRRQSTQQISSTSRQIRRSNDSPVIGTSGNRHLTSSADLNPRKLLTHKPTKTPPE